jgi:WD40 repeat protein
MNGILWNPKSRERYFQSHRYHQFGLIQGDLGLYRAAFLPNYISRLDLSITDEIVSGHIGSIRSLHVEEIQSRYVLTGGIDCKICLYDLYQQPNENHSQHHHHAQELVTRRIPSLSTTQRDHRCGHTYAITAVRWFPTDLESFFSSSFDGRLNVWETELVEIAGSFQLGSKIYDCALHPQNYHSLVACATERNGIRLCDLNSGSVIESMATAHYLPLAMLYPRWIISRPRD